LPFRGLTCVQTSPTYRRASVCASEDAKATASRFYYCYLSVRHNLGAARPRRIKFRLAPRSQGQSHSPLSLSYPFKPASPGQRFSSRGDSPYRPRIPNLDARREGMPSRRCLAKSILDRSLSSPRRGLDRYSNEESLMHFRNAFLPIVPGLGAGGDNYLFPGWKG